MSQTEPVIEDSRAVEDLHHLRLMALLHELVREKGNRGAASVLGIDPRTVASCMKTGRLSWRVREALEQGLQSGAGSAAARQRERNDALEGRSEEMEGKLRSGIEEVRAAVAGEVEALREEHARSMRHVERRLVQSETGQDARDGAKAALAAVEQPVVKPAWRLHRELVTQEPGPGEEQVYGDAMPVIVEWRRQARAEYAGAKNRLDKAVARRRVLELEIAIIEEHELTLPRATYPWDWSARRDQVWRRRQSLEEARVERNRAVLRRWLRRVLTLGLWKK